MFSFGQDSPPCVPSYFPWKYTQIGKYSANVGSLLHSTASQQKLYRAQLHIARPHVGNRFIATKISLDQRILLRHLHFHQWYDEDYSSTWHLVEFNEKLFAHIILILHLNLQKANYNHRLYREKYSHSVTTIQLPNRLASYVIANVDFQLRLTILHTIFNIR